MRERKVSKALLAARALFVKRVCAYVQDRGAEREHADYNWFRLETAAGNLQIHVSDSWIHTCFDNQHAGYVFTSGHCRGQTSNEYSGKWNFHLVDETAVLRSELALQNFTWCLEKLLAYEPTPRDYSDIAAREADYRRRWPTHSVQRVV